MLDANLLGDLSARGLLLPVIRVVAVSPVKKRKNGVGVGVRKGGITAGSNSTSNSNNSSKGAGNIGFDG